MMNHASGKDYDPSAWAKQRKERIKKASKLRHQRQAGSPDRNHTFKPQLVASNDGASSKLPMGARITDTAGATRGAYDLSILDSMEDVFPPKRTTNNIYRDNRHQSESADLTETRDSLDRLAVSTSDRQRLSRTSSMGSSNSGAPPPLPLPGGITVHDNARNTDDYERRRCATDETEESRSLRRGYREENPGRCRRGPTREEARRYDTGVDSGHGGSSFGADAGRPAGSGDALTHEVDQRPHVRGSLNEGPQGWPDHGVGGSEVGRGHERESIEPSVTRRDGSYRGWGLERGQRDPGPERDQLAVGEDGAFFTSLRGEGCGRNGDGVSRRSAKRYPRRPEWNNDTAGAASLGGAHVAIVTENSPASVQGRQDARWKNTENGSTDSPYAAGGGSSGGGGGGSGGNTGVTPAWKHKHTKTLPWGQPHGGAGASVADTEGGGGWGAGNLSRTQGAAPRREAEGAGCGGGREGYRLQVMPSPSTGNLARCRVGGSGGENDEGTDRSVESELPAEKDQLRRNLSLLKRKMHSQAGSRRSQSAGPRAGELSGDPDAPNGTGYADPRHPGRQQLHMTTGTAPAMMPAKPGAFRRDGVMAGRAGDRRGPGGGRIRPPPEGPGSPYAIDPNPRHSAAPRASLRPHHNRSPQNHDDIRDHDHQQQQRQQQQEHRGHHASGYGGGRVGNGSPHLSDGKSHDRTEPPSNGLRDAGQRDRSFREGAPRAKAADGAHSGARGRAAGDIGVDKGVDREQRSGDMARSGGVGGVGSGCGALKSSDRRRAWGAGERRDDGGRGGGGGLFGSSSDLPDDAFPDEVVELRQCGICGRRFNPDALERHSRACQSVFQAKRKVFNAAEMRVKGTELEKYAKRNAVANGGRGRGRKGKGEGKPPPRGFDDTPVGGGARAPASKWRQQSSQFRDAIRQARMVTDAQRSGKSLADLPPPKPSAPDPSLVPCPHCHRRFSEAAGKRHIQHCKDIKAKPSVLKKGSGALLGHAARKTSGAGGSSQRW